MLDCASCDDCRQCIGRYSLLSHRLRKSVVGVSRGETKVATLLSARRVGKALLDFVMSFIDVFGEFCCFLCSKVHLASQVALRDWAASGFNRAAQQVLVLADTRIHRCRH